MIWIRYFMPGRAEPVFIQVPEREGGALTALELAEKAICVPRNAIGEARDRRYVDDRVRYLGEFDARAKKERSSRESARDDRAPSGSESSTLA